MLTSTRNNDCGIAVPRSSSHLDEPVELVHALNALLVAVAERMTTLAARLLEHALDRIETLVEVLERRAEREAHEVVARRVEEVPAVRGVDVEEDAGDDDRLLLEQLLEERQPGVERRGQLLEVEPDVERRLRRDGYVQLHLVEALQNVVALGLKVSLERYLLGHYALRIQERDSGKLESGEVAS